MDPGPTAAVHSGEHDEPARPHSKGNAKRRSSANTKTSSPSITGDDGPAPTFAVHAIESECTFAGVIAGT